MKRIIFGIVVLMVAAGTITLAGRTVGSWSGTGAMTTESFTISSHEWKVSFESDALIFIYVRRDNGTAKGEPVARASGDGGSGYTVVRGAGTYWLEINPVGRWSATVEEL